MHCAPPLCGEITANAAQLPQFWSDENFGTFSYIVFGLSESIGTIYIIIRVLLMAKLAVSA